MNYENKNQVELGSPKQAEQKPTDQLSIHLDGGQYLDLGEYGTATVALILNLFKTIRKSIRPGESYADCVSRLIGISNFPPNCFFMDETVNSLRKQLLDLSIRYELALAENKVLNARIQKIRETVE